QAEDGIRDLIVTGVQTCALPIFVFPAELGGAGMGYVEYVTSIEELSRVDGSVGIIVAAHTSLCSNHIYLAGNDAQKKKYIPKLRSEERRVGKECRSRGEQEQ